MASARRRTRRPVALAVIALLALGGCTSRVSGAGSQVSTSSSTPSSAAPSPSPSASSSAPALDAAHRALAAMSESQKIGQLFMVGSDDTFVDQNAINAITQNDVGSVILMGNSTLSVQDTLTITAKMQASAGSGPKLFIATDQEGGQVQRLRGPGFSSIPEALQQGTLAPASLRADAKTWGSQLAAAGVNLNLAPVADTVPSAEAAQTNPPIGQLDREYGYDPGTVTSHAVAVLQGFADAGIDATAKHFPGLGRVTANTDTTAGVTDTVTGPSDPYLAPFAAAVGAGVPFVMMSTAIYTQIDSNHPAAFSPIAIGTLLRGNLKFGGVVISDDLGAAQQVASVPVGERATDFIAAGGDMVLTVDPSTIAPMTAAVLTRAQSDPAFAAQVNAAALTVLQAKQARGLLAS